MSGSIGWIRFDQREYDQAAEARALLATPGTRDELGLGGIRDRFADTMFPGTSTIQTRLRYAVFVGWIYDRYIDLPTTELVERARAEEIELIRRLERGQAGKGIIGTRAGEELVRLPSMSYWTLLQQWRGQRAGEPPLPSRSIWLGMDPTERRRWPLIADPSLKPVFKKSMDFILSDAEIEYLKRRLGEREKGGQRCLFHELLKGDAQATGEHPSLDDVNTHDVHNKTVLLRARVFSELTWGASLAYNILLLERRLRKFERPKDNSREDEELLAQRNQDWRDWQDTDRKAHSRMVLDHGFFSIPNCADDEAVTFVQEWASVASTIKSPTDAFTLISGRERRLKNPSQRRFESDRALARWGGASDINQARFRWFTARTFLEDLKARGLQQKASAVS